MLALSSFLFAAILDDITRVIQGDVFWCMLFVDDFVLVDETREGLNIEIRVGVTRFQIKLEQNKVHKV